MPAQTDAPLIDVRDLTYQYENRRLLGRSLRLTAVEHVDIRIAQGSITGIAGASGSGKSTLARCVAGLETPARGAVFYRGKDLALLDGTQLLQHRRKVQIVWQDPAVTLNPRFTAARAIAEPMAIARAASRAEQRRVAVEWMERVGLPADVADRPTLEFSGGQRYRIAIARGLTLNPEVLIFDESFSALDAPLRRRILGLLMELQSCHNLTYILISHDLGLLSRWCHNVIVMYRGRIVEAAPVNQLLAEPVHPHSKELVAAIPFLPADWPV